MPIRMTPTAEEVIPFKTIRMDGFSEAGPFEEHFAILAFLHNKVHEAAQKAATTTVTSGGGRVTKDEYNHQVYVAELIKAQLKGWRLIAPPEADPKDVETVEIPADDDVQAQTLRLWTFSPENIARLPWDVRAYLTVEIQACGGLIATESLIVTTDSGALLDFRRQVDRLAPRAAPEVPDPERDAGVPEGEPGVRVQRTR